MLRKERSRGFTINENCADSSTRGLDHDIRKSKGRQIKAASYSTAKIKPGQRQQNLESKSGKKNKFWEILSDRLNCTRGNMDMATKGIP